VSDCRTPDEFQTEPDLEALILDNIRGESYNWCCDRHYDTKPEQILDAYKAGILHEAAEKIRAANFGDPYYTGTGQHDAANLIDPEVA
jgi:hypothetical protein